MKEVWFQLGQKKLKLFSVGATLMIYLQVIAHLTLKIRDTVTGGSVLASGAQPPASVANFFPVIVAHTLLGSVKMV